MDPQMLTCILTFQSNRNFVIHMYAIFLKMWFFKIIYCTKLEQVWIEIIEGSRQSVISFPATHKPVMLVFLLDGTVRC